MLFYPKTYPIGLDLGTQCINMLQLETTRAGITARASGRYAFPEDLELNSPERRELAVKGVEEILGKNPFRGRKVVSAVPDTQVAIRLIHLPQMPAAELERKIWFEAADKLPFDIQSAQLKYLSAGPIHKPNEGLNQIIVLAVQEQDIIDHINLLSAMSVEPVAIDVGPCALFRVSERFLSRQEDAEEVSFVVDIGATTTKMVIGHGADVAFVKIIDLGSRDMVTAVANHFQAPVAEALKLIKRLDIVPGPDQSEASGVTNRELAEEVFNATKTVLSELGREISMSLRYHAVTFRGYRPAVITLTGGWAYSKNTSEFLSKSLSLPVKLGDPFRYTDTSRIDLNGSRRKPAPGWSVSAGLALRDIIKINSALGDAA